MPDDDENAERGPSPAEAVALAIAGPAFAIAILAVRNATPVPAGLFDALAALLVAWGLAPLAHRKLSPAAGTSARGAGLVAAALLAFSTLGANLDAAAIPLALILAGATVLQADSKTDKPRPAVILLGGTLTLGGLALGIIIADAFPHAARLRFALVGAGLLGAAGMAARLAVLRSGHRDLAPMPAGVLTAAALLSGYAAYRPVVAATVHNLPLYEWALAVSIALLVFGRLRRIAQNAQTAESWSWDAGRHAQDVRPVYDARMVPLAAAIRRWLDDGEGLDEYRKAIETTTGRTIPPQLVETLSANRAQKRQLPKARREAAARRHAAHADVMRRLADPRGPNHGRPQRPLRTNP